MVWLAYSFYHVYKKQNYRKGIKYLRAILMNGSLSNMSNTLLLFLGQAYHWNKEAENAQTSLLKALKLNLRLNRHDSQVYEFLGYVSLRKREYADALFYLDKAIQYSKKGKCQKLCYEVDTPEIKMELEKNKKNLPFLTAYFQQF